MVDAVSSMMAANAGNAVASNKANSVTGNINGISSESTSEELMEVCKDFVSYFVEEILKEVKENMTLEDEDEDSTMSMMTDFHMDSVIESISDKLVDNSGLNFTQQLYEQMKRNYNITD